MDYGSFYLAGPTSYVFCVSTHAVGDINDAFSHHFPTNGSPFTMRETSCSNYFGPWWYSSPIACAYIRLFGPINNGFAYNASVIYLYLKTCRVMIKQI